MGDVCLSNLCASLWARTPLEGTVHSALRPHRDTYFPLGTAPLERGSTTILLVVGLVPVDSESPHPHTPTPVHSHVLVLLPPVPCPVSFGLPLSVALSHKPHLWCPGCSWVSFSASIRWGNLLFQPVWCTGRCAGCRVGMIVEMLVHQVPENQGWF